MQNLARIEPVDYLVVGHLTQDLTPQGTVFGGTASYAAVTARAMGMRVGIITAFPSDVELPKWEGITILAHPSEYATTFENIYTPEGRTQYIHHLASPLNMSHVPETWRNTPIVHLGPMAREIDPLMARSFPNAFIGMTLQGWLRDWDSKGRVHFTEWPESSFVLNKASAAVVSIEDVQGDERIIEAMVNQVQVLAVTEGPAGARLYWNGDVRRFRPPTAIELDPVGAGDIFATVFFARLNATKDPWEATRCANALGAISVTRPNLQGVPTPFEVQSCFIEVIEEN
jgi:sugar/nucleoside kinase (ribokinase family)